MVVHFFLLARGRGVSSAVGGNRQWEAWSQAGSWLHSAVSRRSTPGPGVSTFCFVLSPVRYAHTRPLANSQCRLANNVSESLAESAAAYTKATARKCLLEKVEVITGEEAESNVLQVRRAWQGAPGSSGPPGP